MLSIKKQSRYIHKYRHPHWMSPVNDNQKPLSEKIKHFVTIVIILMLLILMLVY